MNELKRTILLVEDDPMLRGLLSTVLASRGFTVFTAATAAEAVTACAAHDPDALIVDIELGPGPTGLDLVSVLLPDRPGVGVVFLTRVPDARFIGAAAPEAQSNIAWLRKQDVADPEQLVAVLDQVLRGTADPEQSRSDLAPDRPLAGLSRTQVEVLRLVGRGLTNEEIAELRGTTLRGAESLIRRTFLAAGIDTAEGNPRVLAVRLLATEAALPP